MRTRVTDHDQRAVRKVERGFGVDAREQLLERGPGHGIAGTLGRLARDEHRVEPGGGELMGEVVPAPRVVDVGEVAMDVHDHTRVCGVVPVGDPDVDRPVMARLDADMTSVRARGRCHKEEGRDDRGHGAHHRSRRVSEHSVHGRILLQTPTMLTGKQRRHLRALAHPLKPLVQVGKGGIDDGLVAAVDQALSDHELIKVKVGENAGMDRHEVAEQLAGKTKSEVAQVLGNTVLLYRADPDDPTIELPAAATGEREADERRPPSRPVEPPVEQPPVTPSSLVPDCGSLGSLPPGS